MKVEPHEEKMRKGTSVSAVDHEYFIFQEFTYYSYGIYRKIFLHWINFFLLKNL